MSLGRRSKYDCTDVRLKSDPNSGRRDPVEKERNDCGGRRRLGCPVGGVMLAWMLARTDRPLIVRIAVVIGGTSRNELRVAEALLGHVPFGEDD